MKSLKRSSRRVKKQALEENKKGLFMSMNLPASIVKGINRSRNIGVIGKKQKA